MGFVSKSLIGKTLRPHNQRLPFFALLEDRQGCLGGTLTGGVIRYCNGAFTSLTVKDDLPNNTVVRIDEDEEGTIWIFTTPGLAKWQNGRLIRVAPQPGSPFNLTSRLPITTLVRMGIYSAFGAWRRMDGSVSPTGTGRISHFPSR